jgi:hypothetical protein
MSLSRFALSICVCLPVALVGVLAPGCLAQLPIVTNTTSTPIPGAGHDYLNGPTETVNPANGSLSIRVPVILPPGRGFTLPFSFAYDSNGVNYLGYSPGQGYGVDYWLTPSPTTLTNPWTEGGWSDTVPMVSKTCSPGRPPSRPPAMRLLRQTRLSHRLPAPPSLILFSRTPAGTPQSWPYQLQRSQGHRTVHDRNAGLSQGLHRSYRPARR